MELSEMNLDDFMEKDWGSESSDEETPKTAIADLKPQKKKKKKKKKSISTVSEKTPKVIVNPKVDTNKEQNNDVDEDDNKDKEQNDDSFKDPVSQHKKQLDGLKDKDPEFYKFLKDEGSDLLKFNEEDLDLSSSDDDEGIHLPPQSLDVASDSEEEIRSDDEDMDQEDEDSDADDADKKSKNKKLTTVTQAMINEWKSQLSCSKPSLGVFRQLVHAFRAALVRIDASEVSDKTPKNKNKRRKKSEAPRLKYKVVGSSVFNSVVGLCLQTIPTALAKFIGYFPDKLKQTKKQKLPLPNSCKHWSLIREDLKWYLTDAITLAKSLLEPSVTRVFLRHLLVLLPYFVSFPKIAKALLKLLVKFWSSNDNESIRVLAFLCISRLIKIEPGRFLENLMKQCYLSYVANCKFTSPTTLPMINFMQRTFAEICAVDPELTYRFTFLYIRQLAVHLRKAITTKSRETRQAVYNWQYVHCVGLWCRVLGVLHPNDILQPLIYPLVQVALGVIDLVPTARFFPLRFHITQSLIALGDCTNTYIPLLPYITAPLKLPEFVKKQTGVAVKPLAFGIMLKLSSSQLKEKAYRDGTIDQVYDLLMAYFNSQAHTIAFSEMAVPTMVMLKKFTKECKTPNYCKVLKQILDKVKENGDFIKLKRSEVSFDVKDIDAVVSWEQQIREKGVPLHKHYEQYKRNRQRELAQEIADKNRNVEEKLPTIDRLKFMKESKMEDKEELGDLFNEIEDNEEDEINADFERAIEEGRRPKPKPVKRPAEKVEENESSEEEQPLSPPPKIKKKKVSSSIECQDDDIVKDFQFSDNSEEEEGQEEESDSEEED